MGSAGTRHCRARGGSRDGERCRWIWGQLLHFSSSQGSVLGHHVDSLQQHHLWTEEGGHKKKPGPHGAFLPQHPGAAPCPSPLRWRLLRGAQCPNPVPLSPFLLETPRSIPRDGCWCSRDAPGSLPGISAPSAEQRGPSHAPGSPPLWGCLGTPSPWSCALLQQKSPGAGGGRLHEAGWRDVGVCGVKDGVIWHGLC